jgi:hypothetical protein
VQFPPELADIGDAQRPHRDPGDVDLAHMAEGKAAFDTSASVTLASTSRARGPISDSVPHASVTSSKPHVALGRWSAIQPRSWVRKPVPVTM